MTLTPNNAEALRRIRDHGCMAWCKGRGRAGGAVSRMFDRMAEQGWCTPVPHEITPAGRKALHDYDNRPAWCVFCKTKHPGGRTCMGHYP